MNSIQNIFQQTNPYDKFVQQLVQLESQTKLKLEAQQGEQREKKTALGEVSSSISKFVSKVEELQKPENKSFQPLSTSTSNSKTVTIASAAGISEPSDYNITIERLATNDIAMSRVMNGDADDLSSTFGNGSVDVTIGDKTETILVETTYEDEEGVTVDKTNREILESFAEKINDAFRDTARANLFDVTGEEVQFSLNSLETGYDNRIEFSGATGVLEEITHPDNMSHLIPQEDLNAEFVIDGIRFERGENTVDDAIGGLTFNLLKDTGEQETMSVTQDAGEARSNVNSFISAFNDMNQSIRDRTFIDSENDRRGALQDMRSVRNLTYSMRQTGLLPLEDAGEEELSHLSEIGIGFENDGSMHIEDADLLTDMLEQKPDDVEQLFIHENSVVSRMREQAEAYVKNDTGVLSSLESGVDQQIDRLDNRIAAQERYLEQYEERQRSIFNELQMAIQQGEAQFEQVMNFRTSMGI